MKKTHLTPYALERIETARFLQHVKLAIEKTLGIKLKVRALAQVHELTEKGKRKK
jgi:hypothetical protein